jgi:hypothetical protein
VKIYTKVIINELELEQIKKQLNHIGTSQLEAPELLSLINKYNTLKEVIKTPFYFNLLQSILSNEKFNRELELDFSVKTGYQIKEKIVDLFCKSVFNKTNIKIEFIKFFAIKTSNLSYFELSSMDYNWIDKRGSKNRWNGFINFFIRSLPYIPLFTLTFTVFTKISLVYKLTEDKLFTEYIKEIFYLFISNLFYVFLFFPFFLFFIVFTGRRENVEITTKETFYITPEKIIFFFKRGVKKRLLLNVSIGVLVFFFSNIKLAVIGTTGLFLAHTANNIIFGSLDDFEADKQIKLIQIKRPYQRFFISMRFLHFSILEHFYLRIILWKKGKLPFKLVSFLNEMTKLGILESDGASWTFRHKILQEYLINYNKK